MGERTGDGVLLVWLLSFDLSGMGDPTSVKRKGTSTTETTCRKLNREKIYMSRKEKKKGSIKEAGSRRFPILFENHGRANSPFLDPKHKQVRRTGIQKLKFRIPVLFTLAKSLQVSENCRSESYLHGGKHGENSLTVSRIY
ncbi:hypothetical protein ABEB36_015528 [Hypothenemus hampei]|uniref:Uncharacterized protein n=1 Tax=Hypothenemus hampei TaxID=57062 RepID=A0ABD1DZE7_HYPHA